MKDETLKPSSHVPPDIFFRIDTEGKILFLSKHAERLIGRKLDETRSSGAFWELFEDFGHREKLSEKIITSLDENGRTEPLELLMKTMNDAPLRISLQAYYFMENELLTIEGSIRDTTNTESRYVGESTAKIAHEINNQLTSASLSIQLISQKINQFAPPETLSKRLDSLQRNVDKAAALAKNLMATATVQGGDKKFRDGYIG